MLLNPNEINVQRYLCTKINKSNVVNHNENITSTNTTTTNNNNNNNNNNDWSPTDIIRKPIIEGEQDRSASDV